MIDLKLNAQHDLLFKDNKLVIVEGINQKAQQIDLTPKS